MRTTRFLAPLVIGLALVLGAGVTSAATKAEVDTDTKAARALVQHIADEASDILKRNDKDARQRAFRKLFEDSFNAAAIGRFVLGRNREGLTPAQFDRFMAVFQDLVAKTTTTRLAGYAGEKLKILDVKSYGAHWMVVSQASPQGRQPVRFDWVVARAKSGPKVVDIRVENLSMAITERDEFASVLRDNNGQIDSLIAFMQDKIRVLDAADGPHASAKP
ncbi:MAG: phospholipid-binding protein MlaC [Candidatus Eiseniibacteriota bacterium]